MAIRSKPQTVTSIGSVEGTEISNEFITELDLLRERVQFLECQNTELELQEQDLNEQLAALRTSQADLEAQNAEIKVQYKEQRNTDTRFRELFDLAPVGYVSLSSEGIINKANLAAIHCLKSPGASLIDTPFSNYLSTDDQLRLHEHLMSVVSSHLSDKWVVNLQLPNNESLSVMLVTSAIRNRQSHTYCYQVMIIDISEQLNNERLLRKAKDFLEQMAHHDPLTSLPNRTLFRDNLQSLLSYRRHDNGKVGVIYFDLDGFKPVNDSFGHAAGDKVLKEVADRVSGLLRPGDSMARLGGDEFTVIMDNPADAEETIAYAQSIAALIRKPFELDDAVVSVSSSIGISLFPTHARKIDDLVKGADAAMYQAKQAGRDQVVMFTRESLETIDRRSVLETSLVNAVQNEQLVLHYQPIYDIKSLKVISVEALVRWQHPTLGVVLPGEFIPLAEKTDQIITIGEWVLDRACQQAQAWKFLGIDTPIAVNVSGRQLMKPNFASQVGKTLARYELPVSAIEIEITETAIVIDHAQRRQSIQQLMSAGHLLTIDDFGTGHSSLGRLVHLPVSRLKIDRVFISDMDRSEHMKSLIKSIIMMAHELGLQVVSEGIECQDQLAFLADNQCDAIQGFMMSRAVSAADITKLLAFNSDVVAGLEIS